jgi:uncharacterized protein (TIGR03067 family)
MAKDIDQLQGSWSVTALETDGQNMPAEMLAGARIEIRDERFTSTGMGFDYEGRLQLDESTTPRRIDMKFDAGPPKGTSNLGIYELTGDTWKLCLATRGTVRPAAFAAPPGSGFALETLVRGDVPAVAKSKPRASKAKKSAPAASSGPATEFEGEWSLVSAVMDGKPMEESMVKWVRRVSQGNQTTVLAGPQTMLKVEFTHDPSQTPKTIDYLNLAGSNKGKTQVGIYEFDGALLKFCLGAPGAPRPAQFQSVSGDGRTLTIWKKPLNC